MNDLQIAVKQLDDILGTLRTQANDITDAIVKLEQTKAIVSNRNEANEPPLIEDLQDK